MKLGAGKPTDMSGNLPERDAGQATGAQGAWARLAAAYAGSRRTGLWSWVSGVRVPSLTPKKVQVRSPGRDTGRGF